MFYVNDHTTHNQRGRGMHARKTIGSEMSSVLLCRACLVRHRGWMDLDWAKETGTRLSHPVGPVSWKSRQDSVALSTSRSEYIYGCERGRQEIQYFCALLRDIGSTRDQPPTSTRTIYIALQCLLILCARNLLTC